MRPLAFIISLFVLFLINTQWQKAICQEIQIAGNWHHILKEPPVRYASDWKLKGLDGNQYRFSDFKDKLILSEFWGLGCGPCIKVAPDICYLDSVYQSRGLKVIAIESVERNTVKEIKKFKQKYNMDYFNLVGGKKVAEKYKVTGYPTFFLINNETTEVLYVHIGWFYDIKKNELTNLIESKI